MGVTLISDEVFLERQNCVLKTFNILQNDTWSNPSLQWNLLNTFNVNRKDLGFKISYVIDSSLISSARHQRIDTDVFVVLKQQC